MQWPVSEVRFWAEFLSHEPSPEGRIEYAIASLHATYVNTHLKKGAQAKPLSDFVLFQKAWEPQAQAVKAGDDPLATSLAMFGRVNRKR